MVAFVHRHIFTYQDEKKEETQRALPGEAHDRSQHACHIPTTSLCYFSTFSLILSAEGRGRVRSDVNTTCKCSSPSASHNNVSNGSRFRDRLRPQPDTLDQRRTSGWTQLTLPRKQTILMLHFEGTSQPTSLIYFKDFFLTKITKNIILKQPNYNQKDYFML